MMNLNEKFEIFNESSESLEEKLVRILICLQNIILEHKNIN